MSFKKNVRFLLPLILLLTGLYLCPVRIFGPEFSKIPGDLGDARFNNYILEHDYQYFRNKLDNYWDAPFMYPFKNTIAFSDNLLGTAPFYAAFRVMGYDRETTFQCWLLLLFTLNFLCCYWALLKWSGENILASAGAYIFAFSILLVANIYNVQTVPRFIVPLVFYWLWMYMTQKRTVYFAYVAFGLVFQFYCGIYLGFLLLFALLFFFIAYFLVYKDLSVFRALTERKRAMQHLLILFIAGLIFYPLIQPYIEISRIISPPLFEEVLPTIPTWRSYFFTSKAPVLWGALSEHGYVLQWWWCHFMFIGALPWIAVACTPFVLMSRKIEKQNKKFILFLVLGLAMCWICCLNMDGWSLYKFFYKLPGFSSMRSMNRIINTEVFFFILLMVFVFRELKNRNRLLKGVVWMIAILVVLDNAMKPEEIMRYDKNESRQRIEQVKHEMEQAYDKRYKAVAVMLDSTKNVNMIALHLDVMLAAQELGVPVVNAYSGHTPGGYNQFFAETNSESLIKWCEFNRIDTSMIQQIRR